MDRVLDILWGFSLFFVGVLQSIGYWFDGVKIDFLASEAYREEAIAANKADAEIVGDYASSTWRFYEAEDYNGLTKAIQASQERTESGAPPLLLWSDMDIFDGDYFEMEERLDAWVASEPDNWVAYAARAENLVDKGWRARGAKWASKTSDEQWAGMREAFDQAESDVKKVLALKPTFSGAYYNYLSMAKASERDLTEREIIDAAAQHGVDDYYLRYQYMQTQEPKWGGSYEVLRRFALESQSKREGDPQLYQLLGVEYHMRGKQAAKNERWEDCVKHYTKAFEYGDLWAWRYGRANCYEQLDQIEEMIADLSYPAKEQQRDSVYARISRAQVKLKQYDNALASIKKAIEIDNEVISHTNYAGWLQLRLKDYDAALSSFAQSLSVLPSDVYAAENTAWIHLKNKDKKAALPFLEVSVKYDEENAYKWFRQADILFSLGDPAYRGALEQFLKFADWGDTRWLKRIEMAEQHLAGEGEFKHMLRTHR